MGPGGHLWLFLNVVACLLLLCVFSETWFTHAAPFWMGRSSCFFLFPVVPRSCLFYGFLNSMSLVHNMLVPYFPPGCSFYIVLMFHDGEGSVLWLSGSLCFLVLMSYFLSEVLF